jgi:hypothetical protein
MREGARGFSVRKVVFMELLAAVFSGCEELSVSSDGPAVPKGSIVFCHSKKV